MKGRGVYSLWNRCKGETVFLLGAGPSLLNFPLDWLLKKKTIVINGAIEIFPEPWIWLFVERAIAKIYGKELKSGKVRRLAVNRRFKWIEKFFKGKELYYLEWRKPLCAKFQKRGKIFWWNPEINYLPGHGSIATIGLSLACVLGARRVVMLGVDFSFGQKGEYYNEGIRRHKGPGRKSRALGAGLRSMKTGFKCGLWEQLDVFSICPYVAKKIPQIKAITPKEVLSFKR